MAHERQANKTGAAFVTTGWTLLDELSGAETERRAEIEQELAMRYWPPIYAWFRRSGEPPAAAEDLTQGFFSDVVLGRNLFDRADQDRGRLRTYLRTCARRYRIDANQSTKGRRWLLIEPADFEREEASLHDGDPDSTFDRSWAAVAMQEALGVCEERIRSVGLDRHWQAFDAFIVQPTINGTEAPSLDTVAAECGFASRVHAASALKVVRKHFQMALREVASATAREPDDQEAEYQHLVKLLG